MLNVKVIRVMLKNSFLRGALKKKEFLENVKAEMYL